MINLLQNSINVSHLAWIMYLYYLNLKCLSRIFYHWVVTERNTRIYLTLTVASNIAIFESSWLQSMETIATEGVQNGRHWSGRNETVTENGVGQAGLGLCRYCGSHLPVASLIALDQWCMFCIPFVEIFSTCCYQLDSNLANFEATVKVG